MAKVSSGLINFAIKKVSWELLLCNLKILQEVALSEVIMAWPGIASKGSNDCFEAVPNVRLEKVMYMRGQFDRESQ